jgi:hypothetical protein
MRMQFLWLLTVTVAFEGIRAGAGTFRMLLDLPARFQIGPVAFAELSRATDLSGTGIAFYAAYGIGGLALTLSTFVLSVLWKLPFTVQFLTGISAASSVLIVIFTVPAAPLMWAIGAAPNDAGVLMGLIEPFVFWTNIRIGLADLSFVAVLLCITHIASRQTGNQG